MELTPLQLHYFKRELISKELEQEIEGLKKSTDLTPLLTNNDTQEYPFLQYLTKKFVLEFPLLKKGNERGFFDKLQVLLNEYSKLDLNTYTPKSVRDSQKRVLLYKIQKLLIISLSSSIKTVQKEESIQLLSSASTDQQDTSIDVTRLESEEDYLEWIGLNGLRLNIVTIRDFYEKRTIREHLHTDFIIETNIIVPETEEPVPTVYVARRHGQFRQLRDDLKSAFPSLDLPSVPSKTRDTRREKDRISLRSFLRRLSAHSEVANSDIFRDFLLNDPVQLTEEQEKDAAERASKDEQRVKEEKEFRERVDKKIVELDGLLEMLKKQIMKPNGLVDVFNVIKTTETIDQLPAELQKAIEWGRINFAFVLHTQFITSDRSVENVANLKRTHTLMPYRAVAQILKLSNPFAMVKGVLDLFLAQPLGSKSLFQRIVLVNMNEQAKDLDKDIQELETKINDATLCLKIKNAVLTKLPTDVNLEKSTPIQETLELLKNPNIQPTLTPQQIIKVAFATQPDKLESRQLVEDLYKLWTLVSCKQEQEQLMSLVFQGVTGEIVKDLFAIFYEPLAEVYKAANIGDTIGHVSNFINDLIQVIESSEGAVHTAQPFIDLVQRHEAEFYQFVHNVHAQDQTQLFDNLLKYADSLFSFVTNGVPEKIDLYQIVQDAGVRSEEYSELKQEVDALVEYHRARKQRHLERKRQKLMTTDDLVDSQEAFEFLPGDNQEIMHVFNDMAEMDSDEDEEDDDSSLAAHEMTLPLPELNVILRVVPAFVEAVKRVL